jgi:hypothetical protein
LCNCKEQRHGRSSMCPTSRHPLVNEVYCDHHKALAEEAKRAN